MSSIIQRFIIRQQIKEIKLSVSNVWDNLNEKCSVARPFVIIVSTIAGTIVFLRVKNLIERSEKPIYKRLLGTCFSYFRRLPFIRRKIELELLTVQNSLEKTIHESDEQLIFFQELPKEALSIEKIKAFAKEYGELNKKFNIFQGKVSGTVYTDLSTDHINLLKEIFELYAYSNPLHPEIFPGCRKMEAEVVRIVANFFHGPLESCGTMTSGGTESIILVCYASRTRAESRGITNPVIVAPKTAHAAFEKAATLLNMRIRYVKVDPKTQKVDLNHFKKSIKSDTCLLVGSAPNFSSGTIDDIPAIAELGLKFNIPVHVDACLGGFLIAFAEEIGLDIPMFDFRLSGVTSISCDTHKYGYAPKGTSLILYRSPEYLHNQYFSITDWPGGIYATPTLSGSRPGLNIALTWATLLYFGKEGYIKRAKKITNATSIMADAIAKISGIELLAKPEVSIIAFSSQRFNIYAVADRLSKLGWNLNTLQMPDAIHFCLTYNQTSQKVINAFIDDLQKVCVEIESYATKGNDSQTAGIYGMAAQIPDKTLIDEVAYMYLDSCYSMPKPVTKVF